MEHKRTYSPPGSLPQPSSSTDHPQSDATKAAIHEVCAEAIKYFHCGDHKTALGLVNDALFLHPDSAALHNAQGCMLYSISSKIHDPAAKLKELGNAIKSLCQAVALCPNSVSYRFVTALAFFAAGESHASIEECERALMIENPTDPDDDLTLMDETLAEDSSRESRIENVRKKLAEQIELIKNSMILEEWTRTENLKQRLNDISLQQVTEEIESLQRKKKAIIESRLPNVEMPTESPSRDNRFQGRRKYKNLKKSLSNDDLQGQARTYWINQMNDKEKKDLLKIGTDELEAHFDQRKLTKENEFLMEAVNFARGKEKWKFCECCCCGEIFLDAESTVKHIKNAHLGTLSENLLSLVPEFVSQETINVVESGVWNPVDSIAAAKVIDDLSSKDYGVFTVDKWPFCEDRKRALIIEKIREKLRLFVRTKCIAPSHVTIFLTLATSMLQSRIPEPLLEYHRLNLTLLSICFLEVPELKRVLESVEILDNFVPLCSLSETISNEGYGGVPERIVFSSDFSQLHLDKRLLRGEVNIPDDGTAVTSSTAENGDDDEAELPENSDAFVHWLWTGNATPGEQLKAWTSLKETRRRQGREFFEIFEKEFQLLQSVCEQKCKLLKYETYVLDVERTCRGENKEGDPITKSDAQNRLSLLLQRPQESLAESDAGRVSSILKEAESDAGLKMSIQKRKDQLDRELFKVDALILAINAAMRQTELKLRMVSVYDYRLIVVPLWKSFIQAHLKDLIDKDAAEKANAATEALLAELTLDAQNDAKKEVNARQGEGKTKDKMKKKEHRKVTNFQATGASEKQHSLPQDGMEKTSLHAVQGGNYPDPEIGVPGSASRDDLMQNQGELITEEEQMLLSALERQMKFEEEAKEKLALNENMDITNAENVEEGVPLVSSEPGDAAPNENMENVEEGVPLVSSEPGDAAPNENMENVEEGVPLVSSEPGDAALNENMDKTENVEDCVPVASSKPGEDVGSSEE